ncbi:hypothetical protein DMJ13_26470 [halophilic archaeon]|nr:hypothetical protein DMJ13_26470 [halophilic archaeon]
MVKALSLSNRQLVLLIIIPLGIIAGSILFITDGFIGSPDGNASGAEYTNITSCTTISEPGQYALRRDIRGSAGLSDSCITIRANNVVLDGFGHTVNGRGATNSTGIRVEGNSVTDVTIRAVTVTGWNRGIHVMNSSRVSVQNITARGNAEAVTYWNTVHSSISRSKIRRNLFGVVTDNASRNVAISDNRFENNYAGDVKRGRGRLSSNAESVTADPVTELPMQSLFLCPVSS